MDSYKSVQHWSPESWSVDEMSAAEPFEDLEDDLEPESDLPEQSPNERFDFVLWLRILGERPLVFWGGVWVVLLLVAGVAVTGLMSPQLSRRQMRPTEQTTAIAQSTTTQPVPQADEDGESLPVWSLGAIVITCVGGSMMISQRMKLAQQRSRKSLKALKKAASFVPASVSTGHSTPSPFALLPSSELFTQPLPAEPKVQTNAASIPPLAVKSPVVTVVPANQVTPLDWPEGSLADLMDIRYRRHRAG